MPTFDATDETDSYYADTGLTVGNQVPVPTSSGRLMSTDVDLDANGRAEIDIVLSRFRGASFIEDPNDRAGIFVKTDNGDSIVIEAEIGALANGLMARVTYV